MTGRCLGRSATVVMLAAFAIAAPPRPASAGPGEAGRGLNPKGPHQAGADYMVVIWYRDDDALGTFQHQTYDVRKGEYTPAVDDWIAMMRAKYPRYEVRVLPVDLARERGATEKLKVGSVIQRELLVAAARSGVVLGAPMQISPGPYASRRPAPAMGLGAGRPGAGGASNFNLPGSQFPFPMPYTRPRP